jgi:hypothetical protein
LGLIGAEPSGTAQADADDGSVGGSVGTLPTPAGTILPGTAAEGRLAGEPDPALTPGAINPVVTEATIGSTVCVDGWTATIRPPVSFTDQLKVEGIAAYGYSDTDVAAYEEDHLIPLELGGSPADPLNLWPEPYEVLLPDGQSAGARVKDVFETSLKEAVCAGTMTLEQARAEIGDDWVHYFFGIPMASSSPRPGLPSPDPSAASGASPAAPTTGSSRCSSWNPYSQSTSSCSSSFAAAVATEISSRPRAGVLSIPRVSSMVISKRRLTSSLDSSPATS